MLNCVLDGFQGKLTNAKWVASGHCSANTALRDINNLRHYWPTRVTVDLVVFILPCDAAALAAVLGDGVQRIPCIKMLYGANL